MNVTTVLGVASIALILVWNAFFVAAEYAFVAVRRTRLEELVAAGNRRARMVQRIVALGFEIRVEFTLADGSEVWAQLTRSELQKLELREKQIVYLRPGQAKSFNGDSPSGDHGASTPQGAEDGDDAEQSAAV